MKAVLLIISFYSTMSFAQEINKIENDLTGGSKKRWVFGKSERTMGSIITPSADCEFAFIIFDKSNKTYFAQTCKDKKNQKSNFKITEKGPEEHFIEINGINYEVLIYREMVQGKDKEVLLLRLSPSIKNQETKEYYYYSDN